MSPLRPSELTVPSPRLILASTSRYRRELLERLGLPFEVIAPRTDETPWPDETPAALALRLSAAKAGAVAASLTAARPGDLIIGSDQTASLDGHDIIGKPGNHEAARRQLEAASGRTMTFHSGLCLRSVDGSFERSLVVDTRIRFRPLSAARIETYLRREQPYDCAGAAKAEALGITLIESLHSEDPTAIIGLPLIALTSLLDLAGLPPLGPDSAGHSS